MFTQQQARSTHYSDQELKVLKGCPIPRHVAIIPDGNRRWAKQHRKALFEGHMRGFEVVIETLKAAIEIGIEVITLYTFSTENWGRPPEEVEFLMKLLEASLLEREKEMIDNGIQLRVIGDLSRLPETAVTQIHSTMRATEQCKRIRMVLAINYGGRDEMKRTLLKILADHRTGQLQEEQIDEALIGRYLDTAFCGDPDLLIRAGGERRMSNFLLWQSSYCEFYFTDTPWPDFTSRELLNAVVDYGQRSKRFGG